MTANEHRDSASKAWLSTEPAPDWRDVAIVWLCLLIVAILP